MREEMQSIFCNSVATSSRMIHYVTLQSLAKMLNKHKVFFSTK
jgi:hypothetical protein